MGYNRGEPSEELWAIVNDDGCVIWSRGGSSSRPKLMVYHSEESAKKARRNPWTQQVHGQKKLRIQRVYAAPLTKRPGPQRQTP